MKHIYYSFIFIGLQFITCEAQSLENNNFATEELEWKKQWFDIFFQEYRKYQLTDLVRCDDKGRSISFDIERKARAINEFSLGETLTELEKFLASNPIKFDSLIMDNTHSWHNEAEFNFAPVSFYLYSKEEIKILIAYFDADRKPTIEEYKEDVNILLDSVHKLQNGCGYGFTTITYFDKGLSNLEIKRIVINPNE